MLGSIFQTYRQYSREQYESHKLWATGTCAPSAEFSRREKTRLETSREPLLTFRRLDLHKFSEGCPNLFAVTHRLFS